MQWCFIRMCYFFTHQAAPTLLTIQQCIRVQIKPEIFLSNCLKQCFCTLMARNLLIKGFRMSSLRIEGTHNCRIGIRLLFACLDLGANAKVHHHPT